MSELEDRVFQRMQGRDIGLLSSCISEVEEITRAVKEREAEISCIGALSQIIGFRDIQLVMCHLRDHPQVSPFFEGKSFTATNYLGERGLSTT